MELILYPEGLQWTDLPAWSDSNWEQEEGRFFRAAFDNLRSLNRRLVLLVNYFGFELGASTVSRLPSTLLIPSFSL